MRMVGADDPSSPGVLDDAIDELAEAVLSRGGRAYFVSDGALGSHRHVAAILRY